GNYADDEREHEAFENAVDRVLDLHDVAQGGEKCRKGNIDSDVGKADERAAEPACENPKNDKQGQSEGDGHQARQHQVVDGIDVHGSEGIDLLVDTHGTDFGGHGRADSAGDEDGHHHGGQLFAN